MPRLFFGKTKNLSPVIGCLSTIPVKKYGLGILNAVTPDKEKCLIYKRGSSELVQAVTGGGALSNADHLRTLSEGRRDGKKDRDIAHKSRLKGLVINIKGTDNLLLLRAKSRGAWMSARCTTVSGTVLSATEFRYFLCACYNVSPVNL